MDAGTIDVYERRATEYAARRPPTHAERARALAATAPVDLPILDAGCGPGGYVEHLRSSGHDVIALDAAAAMLDLVGERTAVHRVRGALERLPFARAALGGAWGRNSYLHVARHDLPRALASLHAALAEHAPVTLSLLAGDGEGPLPDDDLPGRRFSRWSPEAIADVVVGAGFDGVGVETVPSSHGHHVLWVGARRARSLADTVGPGMRLLVCGLNPSLYAADAGVGYARPGNRFWRAAVEAGVLSRPLDPWHALDEHGVGMTDLVKRATVGAGELAREEYAAGLARVERLCAWLRPRTLLLVGLDGWRAAADRRALAGWQPRRVSGTPTYVMPSTSGRNAATRLSELVAHLRAAAAGPPS